jgi:exosome complex RNA-binding protein Rrp42 (RNase PH superfamily)
VLDPSLAEEACMDSGLTLVLTAQREVCALSKVRTGGGGQQRAPLCGSVKEWGEEWPRLGDCRWTCHK